MNHKEKRIENIIYRLNTLNISRHDLKEDLFLVQGLSDTIRLSPLSFITQRIRGLFSEKNPF